MLNNRQKGGVGEEQAAAWLEQRGYEILQRNFQTRQGELDIVARSPAGVLCFVEVKSIRSENSPLPEFQVTSQKMHQMQKMAQRWCAWRGWMDGDMRFDVVAIDATAAPPVVRHIENAFIPDTGGYYR